MSKTFHACLLAGQLVVLTCCAGYWWRFLTTYAKLKAGGPPSQRCNCLAVLNVDPDPRIFNKQKAAMIRILWGAHNITL